MKRLFRTVPRQDHGNSRAARPRVMPKRSGTKVFRYLSKHTKVEAARDAQAASMLRLPSSTAGAAATPISRKVRQYAKGSPKSTAADRVPETLSPAGPQLQALI